ncbi:fumarylacetoacetate hydrolase family protein [Escherichia coli]
MTGGVDWRDAASGYGRACPQSHCRVTGVALISHCAMFREKMKKAGQPWEKAKAFDNSCLLSGFIPRRNSPVTRKIQRWASVNGEQRQQGSTADMIHKIVPLIGTWSKFFTLKAVTLC